MEKYRLFEAFRRLEIEDMILYFFSFFSLVIGVSFIFSRQGNILFDKIGDVFYWGALFLITGVISFFTAKNFYLHYLFQCVPFQMYTSKILSVFNDVANFDYFILSIFLFLTISTSFFTVFSIRKPFILENLSINKQSKYL